MGHEIGGANPDCERFEKLMRELLLRGVRGFSDAIEMAGGGSPRKIFEAMAHAASDPHHIACKLPPEEAQRAGEVLKMAFLVGFLHGLKAKVHIPKGLN